MIVKKHAPKVLICDDDRNLHLAIKSALGRDYEFKSAFNGDEAILLLKKHQIDILLLDMELRTPTEGLEIIPRAKEAQSDAIIIFFSGRTNLEHIKTAIRLGAHDYVSKDCSAEDLAHVFAKALQHKTLQTKASQLQHEIKSITRRFDLIGTSEGIQKIRRQIDRARTSSAPVVIQGETGTGKEVVARLLRKTLPDQSLEPFVAVDSSTIQSSVAESVLFGFEKGSFTGAEKTTRGLFEEADGGVIYFDELGNMPLEIQNKLLRVIQEKEVLRIGSARPLTLDFRVVCATNRNLEKMVAEGRFKDDLFQRLNVLQITIPPLRERIEDIPLLLNHFVEMHTGVPGKITFLPETIERIQSYSFPGNVRELSNLVLYLDSMCEDSVIAPMDLPPQYHSGKEGPPPAPRAAPQPAIDLSQTFYEAVESFEKAYLSKAYEKMEGNISRMSMDLRMDRSYLHRKLKNYGIHMAR